MFGYFGIIGHSGWLDIAYLDIPDSINQLLHVLTAVNMTRFKTPGRFLWQLKPLIPQTTHESPETHHYGFHDQN